MDTDYLRQVDWWSRVNRGDHEECWLWTQSCGSHGYGQTWDGSTVLLAHRVAWTLVNGEIPDGLTIDHVCRNRKCCNPSHLRLLSNIDNATDNGQISKTHCPARHEYGGANLYIDRKGHRRCRECARLRSQRRA